MTRKVSRLNEGFQSEQQRCRTRRIIVRPRCAQKWEQIGRVLMSAEYHDLVGLVTTV